MKEIAFFLAVLTIAAKTFGQMDSLELWNYRLDSPYTSHFKDSVKPIAHISFWRTRPLPADVEEMMKLYGEAHGPAIDFEIFDIKDSTFCKESSFRTMVVSSCVRPNVGGDLYIVGKFVLLNRWACVGCSPYKSGTDYCRPVLNFIVKKLGPVSTLNDIVRRMPIMAGS